MHNRCGVYDSEQLDLMENNRELTMEEVENLINQDYKTENTSRGISFQKPLENHMGRPRETT